MAHIARPTCAQSFDVKDTQLGEVVQCPHCRLSLRASDYLVADPRSRADEPRAERPPVPAYAGPSPMAEESLPDRNKFAALKGLGIVIALLVLVRVTVEPMVPGAFAWMVVGCFIFGFCWLVGTVVRAQEDAVARALARYHQALAELKQSPTDPDLRERALALGRSYAAQQRALARRRRRKSPGVLFSEIALMNDINAACVRAAAPVPSPAEEIAALAALCRDGVLTTDEFHACKNRLTSSGTQQIEEVVTLLRKLHELRLQGVLTDSEFNVKKWDVLSRRTIGSR